MNLGGMGTTMGELLVLPIYANLPTDMQVGLGLGGWGGFMVFSMTSDGFNSIQFSHGSYIYKPPEIIEKKQSVMYS